MGKYAFEGLDEKQVAESRRLHGSNELPPVKVESFVDKLLENFSDPLIKILLVALAITSLLAFLGYAEWFEGVGILSAVFLATLVSTISEYKNEASFQELQEKAASVKNNVFRNGNVVVPVFASELVVGDYVLLQAGDKVPADGVLMAGEIQVSQSSLNGEPDLVTKTVAPSRGYAAPDRQDFNDPYLIFRGSVVENGEGVLRVTGVGLSTYYGKLAIDLVSADERESPLQVKLSALADGISTLGYIGSVFIAVSFLFKQIVMDNGYSYNEIVMYLSNWQSALHDVVTSVILAIIIIVVAVPEGLPMMIAIVLSLNMRKLLNSNVLVRKLLGIETAGSIDILFVDKTGTITKGNFTPKLFVSGDLREYDGFGHIPSSLREVLAFAVRESTSSIIGPDGQLAGGNSSDRALLEFLDKPSLMQKVDAKVLKEVLFNSGRKYSGASLQVTNRSNIPNAISLMGGDSKDVTVSAVKGAPEIILSKCTHYITPDGISTRLRDDRQITKKINELSEHGVRVIAVAITSEPLVDDVLPKNLSLVGIVGVLDEIRKESESAIKLAQGAGIQVVMVTGDKKETAVAVAQQVGLVSKGDLRRPGVVMTSQELQEMDDHQLSQVIPQLRVIARALPTDKSRFVRVAQSLSKVVGMTGDGVNDSAALKQADVGFAMGGGSEVAKEAADIVILDDNFSSITQAVLYGRTIYKSIQKFIVFQSTINVASSMIVFLGPFMGFDFPLTIIQLLWVNLVMDTLAALALGGEPALSRYMKEKPIKRDQNIITPRMWYSILTTGVFIASLSIAFLTHDSVIGMFKRNGSHSEPVFLTAFFCFFIFLSILNAFNVRTPRINIFDHLCGNRGFILVVSFIFMVQICFTYIGGKVLRTVGLSLQEWVIIIIASLVIIPYGIFTKTMFNLLTSRSPSSKKFKQE